MNLSTIAIIFALFFCSAWAGICMSSGPKKAQSGTTPSHRWSTASNPGLTPQRITAPSPGSARISEEQINDAVAYFHQTNPDFNRMDSSSNNTPPHRWSTALNAGSARISEEQINDAIAYVHGTNGTNFNKHRVEDNFSPQVQKVGQQKGGNCADDEQYWDGGCHTKCNSVKKCRVGVCLCPIELLDILGRDGAGICLKHC
uniref:Uncharacterized protein n=1 Tax=Globodera rostochiensis TaxID=31243 RepID=A0A914HKY0_GLORO